MSNEITSEKKQASGTSFMGGLKETLAVLRDARVQRREASRLAASGNASGQRMARVIERHLNNGYTSADAAAFAKIEALRSALLANDDKINVIDYGAGSRGLDHAPRKAITVAQATRASKRLDWCKLLYALVSEFKPVSCVELGTNVGISAAYQAAAMPSEGVLYTLEGDPQLAEIAQGVVPASVKIVVGRFQDTLPGLLEKSSFDYAFIDGHHAAHPTVSYFNQIIARMTAGVIAFDDISWSKGMRSAWNVIIDHPRVAAYADLRAVGFVVIKPE